MKRIRLYDGCFPSVYSATLAGDNSEEVPTYLDWCREKCDSLCTWYTDGNIKKARKDFYPYRIGWLLEPPSISNTHYKRAYRLRKQFRAIFTFSQFYCGLGRPFRFYPLGGSWIQIESWGMYNKSQEVSIILSKKKKSIGHKLRHSAARRFPNVHKYGLAYKPIESKLEGLAPYRYSIIIESWRGNWYFSEKLIDCMATGTVPIYWGCPDIGKFFNVDGIIQFETIEELERIMENMIGAKDYSNRFVALMENQEKAKDYRIAEDWLFINYPEYFK